MFGKQKWRKTLLVASQKSPIIKGSRDENVEEMKIMEYWSFYSFDRTFLSANIYCGCQRIVIKIPS